MNNLKQQIQQLRDALNNQIATEIGRVFNVPQQAIAATSDDEVYYVNITLDGPTYYRFKYVAANHDISGQALSINTKNERITTTIVPLSAQTLFAVQGAIIKVLGDERATSDIVAGDNSEEMHDEPINEQAE